MSVIMCLRLCLASAFVADVDTPEPDEKSVLTYVSSLYDVFPQPPADHPLYDAVSSSRGQGSTAHRTAGTEHRRSSDTGVSTAGRRRQVTYCPRSPADDPSLSGRPYRPLLSTLLNGP